MFTRDQADCSLWFLKGDLSFPMFQPWAQKLPGCGRKTVHPAELQTWSPQNSCSQCWTERRFHCGWSQTSCQTWLMVWVCNLKEKRTPIKPKIGEQEGSAKATPRKNRGQKTVGNLFSCVRIWEWQFSPYLSYTAIHLPFTPHPQNSTLKKKSQKMVLLSRLTHFQIFNKTRAMNIL